MQDPEWKRGQRNRLESQIRGDFEGKAEEF